MAQINKPDTYFNTKLYTGTGATHNITGVGFQPDWVWIKNRSITANHHLFDIARGATKYLLTNATNAEATDAQQLQSFDTDGFTVGTNGNVNGSGNNIVAWNWLASNTTASNTDGSITSTVSANTTSGFSIVSYTGTGSAATVGHGLGSTPKMFIVKRRDAIDNWWVYNSNLGSNDAYLILNTTAASSTAGGSTLWNSTAPTNQVFSVNTNSAVNGSSGTYIAYCFAEKKGFSKFGSYTGNGSTDGTFIYTGFKPAFLLIKRTDAAFHWYIHDNKRNTFNVMDKELYPSQSSAEATAVTKDFLSNGVKIRGTQVSQNASGGSYIYMAFAENPLVGTNNIPATAR